MQGCEQGGRGTDPLGSQPGLCLRVTATHLDVILLLLAILLQVCKVRAELLVAFLELHDAGLEALELLVLLQGLRGQGGAEQGGGCPTGADPGYFG